MVVTEKERYRVLLEADVKALNEEILTLAGEPMPPDREGLELKAARHRRLLDEVTEKEELLHKFFGREPMAGERAAEQEGKLR